MRLEFMQENINQLQQRRWDFFLFIFYHLMLRLETSAVITGLAPKPSHRTLRRCSCSPELKDWLML